MRSCFIYIDRRIFIPCSWVLGQGFSTVMVPHTSPQHFFLKFWYSDLRLLLVEQNITEMLTCVPNYVHEQPLLLGEGWPKCYAVTHCTGPIPSLNYQLRWLGDGDCYLVWLQFLYSCRDVVWLETFWHRGTCWESWWKTTLSQWMDKTTTCRWRWGRVPPCGTPVSNLAFYSVIPRPRLAFCHL